MRPPNPDEAWIVQQVYEYLLTLEQLAESPRRRRAAGSLRRLALAYWRRRGYDPRKATTSLSTMSRI